MENFKYFYKSKEERALFVHSIRDTFDRIVYYSSYDLKSKEAKSRMVLKYLDLNELNEMREHYLDEPEALKIINNLIKERLDPNFKPVIEEEEEEEEYYQYSGERF